MFCRTYEQRLIRSLGVDSACIVSPKHVKIGRALASGAFGSVYECVLHREERVVCKRISTLKVNEETLYLLKNECTVWSRLSHPHIVAFIGITHLTNAIGLLCARCDSGTLYARNARWRGENRPVPRLSLIHI